MTETVLLSGVVGSTAYGLAGPDSDVDRLGVYAVPTVELHGLHPPDGKRASRVRTSPDVTLHEARKFVSLCLAGNPTVSELLWLPVELYEVRTALGWDLRDLRRSFLSAPRVRDAYLGYATQQFRRLSKSGRFPDVPRSRIEKHARHLMRLVEQGCELWVTGELSIRVRSPERFHEFGRMVADGDVDAASSVLARGEATFDRCATALPAEPDEAAVEAWLRRVRAELWSAA